MLKDHLQKRTLSLVCIGSFNPALVQPYWLVNKKLIKEQEAKDTNLELIHNDLCKYDIGWASIEINQKRFELRSSEEPYFEPLKDLMVSVFTLLPETPIQAIGINHIMNFSLSNADEYYEFGNKLSPLNNWEGFLKDPRLLDLTILEDIRKDGLPGYVRIAVQSNNKFNFGITININDHYSLKDGLTFLKVFSENWKKSNLRAEEIVSELSNKLLNE